MELSELLNWVLGLLTVVSGGGWFINWRAKARQSELEATRTEQDMYQEMLTDLKEHNEVLRRFNKEVSEECEQLRKRVAENENKLHEQDDKIRGQGEQLRMQENKIDSLEHRLELVTDMICGRSNCQQRTKVFLSPVDDDSFYTRKESSKHDTNEDISTGN